LRGSKRGGGSESTTRATRATPSDEAGEVENADVLDAEEGRDESCCVDHDGGDNDLGGEAVVHGKGELLLMIVNEIGGESYLSSSYFYRRDCLGPFVFSTRRTRRPV